METQSILYPVLAMVALTSIVAVLMYRRRAAEMRRGRIHPQKLAGAAAMSSSLEDVGAADSYRNLFEAPVLFYAAALVIYAAELTNLAYVVLAWAYVLARIAHSTIHCSYNRVTHRFAAFVVSLGLLWILWALVAWDLLVLGRG